MSVPNEVWDNVIQRATAVSSVADQKLDLPNYFVGNISRPPTVYTTHALPPPGSLSPTRP